MGAFFLYEQHCWHWWNGPNALRHLSLLKCFDKWKFNQFDQRFFPFILFNWKLWCAPQKRCAIFCCCLMPAHHRLCSHWDLGSFVVDNVINTAYPRSVVNKLLTPFHPLHIFWLNYSCASQQQLKIIKWITFLLSRMEFKHNKHTRMKLWNG